MTKRRELMKRREFIKKGAIGTAGVVIGGIGFDDGEAFNS